MNIAREAVKAFGAYASREEWRQERNHRRRMRRRAAANRGQEAHGSGKISGKDCKVIRWYAAIKRQSYKAAKREWKAMCHMQRGKTMALMCQVVGAYKDALDEERRQLRLDARRQGK